MKATLFLTSLMLIFCGLNDASLIMKGPEKQIVAGDMVTLECYDSNSTANMSQVHFERSSKFSQGWYRLDSDRYYRGHYYCSWRYFEINLEDDRLFLTTFGIQTYMEGLYRCVSDEAAFGSDNSSAPLSITVHYMHELSFTRDGPAGYYSRFFDMQDLRVPLGSDVEVNCSTTASETPEYFWQKEGSDWILPSKTLTLRKVTPADDGTYTCTARHPSVASLSKSRSFTLTVLPEDCGWYETTDGRITLVTIGAGLVLLVLVVSMTAFLCRRAKRRQVKGPIDDHSKTKPIYKGSVDSLESTTGDNQPLV